MDVAFDLLIRLQDVDSEIARLSSLLDAVPGRLQAIETRIHASADVVVQAKEKLAANQKRRRDMEGEVKSFRETIGKYKRQQSEVKTNKENDALKKEIVDSQAKVDGVEERILAEMIAADDIEKEIKAAHKFQAEEEAVLQKEKAVVAAEKADLEKQKAGFEAERAALLPRIPADQRKLYERIVRKMAGVALSRVTDDFCSLCQMRIRPQLLDELIEMRTIITCEACGRILYWVKPKEEEEASEEKPGDANRADE